MTFKNKIINYSLKLLRSLLLISDNSEYNYKRIIVFKLAGLGDFILGAPAIVALRKQYPEAHITLMSSPPMSLTYYLKDNKPTPPEWFDLLNEGVVDAIEMPKSVNYKLLKPFVINFIKRLLPSKSEKTLIVNLQDYGSWSSILEKDLYLSAITPHAAVRSPDHIYTLRGRSIYKDAHQFLPNKTEYFYSLATGKEIDGNEVRQCYDQLGSAYRVGFEDALAHHNLTKKTYIIINCGGVREHKIWPKEKFIELCKKLQSENESLVFMGMPNDAQLVASVTQELKGEGVHDLVGKLSFKTTCFIYAQSKLVISNDGGGAHLGDILGAKVLSIMPSIEVEKLTTPYLNIDNVIYNATECSPCYNPVNCVTGHMQCMKDIGVQEVLELAKKLLNEK